MRVELGEWQPDLPEHENPGAIQAKNCLPLVNSYGPMSSLQSFAAPLAGPCLGAFWIREASGAVHNFAGDASNLYRFNGTGMWAVANRPAGGYSAGRWDFTNFQNRVLATNDGIDPVQFFDLGASAAFADLPGNPPRAKCIGVVRDFVLLGNYEIGIEREPGGFAWSGFNSTEIWAPALATQSGRRRTRGTGGAIQRIVSGSQGLIYRESAIHLVTYVGPPNIWQVDDITTLHGTPAPASVCWSKDLAFYYSTEGFFQINRRTLELTPIGAFKVDNWFTKNASRIDILHMQGAVNRSLNVVWWAFRSSSSSPAYDRLLVYNWAARRWAYAEIETEHIGEFASIGYNLDTIGAVLGGNIDSASISVDSDAYTGGEISFVGFDPQHRSGTFSGPALTAEFDTSEQAIDEVKRQAVQSVRPLVETRNPAAQIQVAAIGRNRLQDNPVAGPFRPVNSVGLANVRANARYMRYRVRIAGGFTHAKGVEPLAVKKRGRR